MAADLVVFDADTIGARMPDVVHDLPAGAKRLKQTADGILNTVVNGEILLTNNEHSGAGPVACYEVSKTQRNCCRGLACASRLVQHSAPSGESSRETAHL